ncbi:MAG TPA: metalloregulator ArsR/SmtB family transcription factor [Pseudonocardiaceae bacterium]|jgi:DNA-binding transcriptional ArsR family regulator
MTAPEVELGRVELGPAAALFRSLGDPTWLAIVRRLTTGPARVVDLMAAVGLAQSTVSKHLACLRDCGLVTEEPHGRASLFRLTQPALIGVLAAAETVLAATGNAIALRPAYGAPLVAGGSRPPAPTLTTSPSGPTVPIAPTGPATPPPQPIPVLAGGAPLPNEASGRPWSRSQERPRSGSRSCVRTPSTPRS